MSVREDGFRADRATVEYASVDGATFQGVADTINAAASTDSFAIVVDVEGSPVELFRGIVTDWRLQEEWRAGPGGAKETIGVLEALDERGKLTRTEADPAIAYRGVEVMGQVRTAYSTLGGILRDMAQRVGMPPLTVEVEADYSISQSVVPAGFSYSTAAAHLLRPAQRIRSGRVDFVRDGQAYVLQKRPLVLPTADVSVPMDIMRLRSYRKTLPRSPTEAEAPAVTTPAQEFADSGNIGGASPPALPSGSYTLRYDLPDGSGYDERSYQFNRIINERIVRAATPSGTGTPPPGTSVAEDLVVYSYDSLLRPTGHIATTFVDGVLVREVTHYIVQDPDHCGVIEHTVIRSNTGPGGVLVEVARETKTKAQSETGVQKALYRAQISSSRITWEHPTYEFSPGDCTTLIEPQAPRFGFMAEPADLATRKTDADAQAGMALVEASFEMPLDTRIMPGRVIEITGTSLVTQTRFYCVSVRASWDGRGRPHRMTWDGEVWV